jgi:hypothetical protein
MSLINVTIEKLVFNRLPYLTAGDTDVVSEFKCEVYHELGVSMGIDIADIEDDSLYGGLQKSLIADVVSCYMLFIKSIQSVSGSTSKISSSSFLGTGLNDLTLSGEYSGTVEGLLAIEIDANGTPDTFKWSIAGGVETTSVPIESGGQVLVDGIIVTFATTTGHTIGDSWLSTLDLATQTSDKILTKAKAGSAEVEWEQIKSGGTGNNGATSIKMDTNSLLNSLKKTAYRKARNLGFIIDICDECSVSIKSWSTLPTPSFIISKC